MSASVVILQQALFGYNAGHNLLASSIDLKTDMRNTLALLTDASGPWPTSGFEKIFTGVSLPSSSVYAVFCTWPAPEMPRPGCVWSHVLLIELADLAVICDLGRLRGIFRRPDLADFESYSNSTSIDVGKYLPLGSSTHMAQDVSLLLTSLYGRPNEPVILEAVNSVMFEDLTFALWSQQWPRLRRNFSFSTGSFSDRNRTGINFDLQIIPGSSRLTLKNLRSAGDNVQSKELGRDDFSDGAWVECAVTDLFYPDRSGLRAFLKAYGPEFSNPRFSFSFLAECFSLLQQQTAIWSTVLEIVAKKLPNPSEAPRLKERLLSQPFKNNELDVQQAWHVIEFLLFDHNAASFSESAFDFSIYAQALWDSQNDRALESVSNIIRGNENERRLAFLKAIASVVKSEDIERIIARQPELLYTFLHFNPSLAHSRQLWQIRLNVQWRVLETLLEMDLSSEHWAKTISAMLEANTSVGVREAVRKSGSAAIEGAFSWLNTGSAQEILPSSVWRDALAGSAADRILRDEFLSPSQLALCCWLVEPAFVRSRIIPKRSDVLKLADEPLERLPAPLRNPTAFLLVSLGLRAQGEIAIRLLSRAFFEVYQALATENYLSESWAILSPELPKANWWWLEWDRCRLLRRAIRNRFRQGEIERLLRASALPRDREIANQVIATDRDEVE